MVIILLLILSVFSFNYAEDIPDNAQITAENSELTNAASTMDLFLVQSGSRYYTYPSKSGSVYPKEMLYRPGSFRLFGWDYPFLSPDAKDLKNSYGFVGNEIGDPLYQELRDDYENTENRTPVISGVITTPEKWLIQAYAGFRQLDHFSTKDLDKRFYSINAGRDEYETFSWFGENLPPYSLLQAGLSVKSEGIVDAALSFDVNDGYLWLYGFNNQYYPLEMTGYRLKVNLGVFRWIFDINSFDYYQSLIDLPDKPIKKSSLVTRKSSFIVDLNSRAFSIFLGLENFVAKQKEDFPFAWNSIENLSKQREYLLWFGLNNTNPKLRYNKRRSDKFKIHYDAQIAYGHKKYMGFDTLSFNFENDKWDNQAKLVFNYGNTVDPFAPEYELYQNLGGFASLYNQFWSQSELLLSTARTINFSNKSSYKGFVIEAWALPWYMHNPIVHQFDELKENGVISDSLEIYVLEKGKDAELAGIKEGISTKKSFGKIGAWGMDFIWQQMLYGQDDPIGIRQPKYTYGAWINLNIISGLSINTNLKRISEIKYNWTEFNIDKQWVLNLELRQQIEEYNIDMFASFLNVLSNDHYEYPKVGNQDRFRIITGLEWLW